MSGFVHDLITERSVTIKRHRLSQISRVTFSLSINNRLSKNDEEFSRGVMNKPINNCTLISNFQIEVKKGSDGSVILQFKAGNQQSSGIFQRIIFFGINFLVFSNIIPTQVNVFENIRKSGKIGVKFVGNSHNELKITRKNPFFIFSVKQSVD